MFCFVAYAAEEKLDLFCREWSKNTGLPMRRKIRKKRKIYKVVI